MRRIAIFLTALLLAALSIQSVDAASGGVQSSRSASATAGTRTPRAGVSGIPRTGIPRMGIPRGRIPRSGIPRTGFGRRGFRGGIGAGVTFGVPLLEPIDPYLYDAYAYPYGVPDYAVPYPPELYASPQPYLPPRTVYAPPSSEGPSQQIWYYCRDPMGYYPYVQNCSSDWQTVPASVLPPPTPQQ